MGTFIIKPTAIASGGTPTSTWNGVGLPPEVPVLYWLVTEITPPATILNIIQNDYDPLVGNLLFYLSYAAAPTIAGSDTLRLDCVGNCIYLDGSLTPTDVNSLPAGFTPTAASVKVHLRSLQFAGDMHLQQGALVEGPIYNTPVVPPGTTVSFDYVTLSSMLTLVNDGFGIRINIPNAPAQAGIFYGLGICYGRIEGTYTLVSSSTPTFTTSNPSPVSPGTTVVVTPTGIDPLDPPTVSTVTMEFVDPLSGVTISISIPTFIATSSLLSFVVPSFAGYSPTTVTFLITGTSFSGSVSLGTFTTLLFLNAPGIYRIIANQAYDTLYNRVDGGTVDVQIPDPYGKTGFIP